MVIDSIQALKKELRSKNNLTIGLVPTMGYLHQGHLSLIKTAKSQNDLVVVSIFVNPSQFGPGEDLETYPRDLGRDLKTAYENGADYIFVPSVSEMYGPDYTTYVHTEGPISQKLCGMSRPTHFRGVTTVVTKLFNIVNPHHAYFGLKDAQQVSVIKRLVKDLNYDIKIVTCPIVRGQDGLALSSRNVYLNPMERRQALILSQALSEVNDLFLKGNYNALELKEYIRKKIHSMNLAKIDYIEIVDFETLEDVSVVSKKTLIALAVYF